VNGQHLASAPASTARPRIRQPTSLHQTSDRSTLLKPSSVKTLNLRTNSSSSLKPPPHHFVGSGWVCLPHTLDPLKKLGLDFHKVRITSLASSFMITLSNMHTNLLAPDALLRRALATRDTTVRKVALLGTLPTLIKPYSFTLVRTHGA